MSKRSSLKNDNKLTSLIAPIRTPKKHNTTTFATFNRPIFPARRSEENVVIPPNILKARGSIKKKSVSFLPNNAETLVELISKTGSGSINNSPLIQENENPFNYNVNFIKQNEEENDIDDATLKKLKKDFPKRFTFIRNGESDYYKIATIKEESEEELDETKKEKNAALKQSNLNLLSKSMEISQRALPKYSSKFLIEELFGEKDDSLESSSSDSDSDSNRSFQEESKDHIPNYKKKKKGIIPKANEKKKVVYNYLQDFLHPTLDHGHDDLHENIEENSKLKKEISGIPQLFRQHTKLITKRKADFLKVIGMNPIERIHIDYDIYPDNYPLRKFRKYFFLSIR